MLSECFDCLTAQSELMNENTLALLGLLLDQKKDHYDCPDLVIDHVEGEDAERPLGLLAAAPPVSLVTANSN